MGKAAGAVAGVFVMGTGAMALLSSVLGGAAEAAALGLMGVGLFFSSAALSGRVVAPSGVAKEA